MEEYLPDPQLRCERWKYSSVFGPSLLLVAAPDTAAAQAIAWVMEDQDGRRIGDPYQDSDRPGGKYVVWKEQFQPLPDSLTFTVVVGDPGKEYSAEFIVPPPQMPR
jgi:hypothetical protein